MFLTGTENSAVYEYRIIIPPTVENTTTDPLNPIAGDDVNVTADISDPEGQTISWAGASVWLDGTPIASNVTPDSISGDTYSWTGLITDAQKDATYNVSIEASDSEGNIRSDTFNFTIEDDAPTVTFEDPPNTTTFDYDKTWNFSASDSDDVPGETYSCMVDLDGSQVDTASGTEPLDANGTFRAGLGHPTLNASCTDDAGNTGWDAVDFTVEAYELLDNETAATAYETENTSYNISIRLGDMVAGANTTLYWNGSAVNSMMLDSSGVRVENATHYFAPPLVKENRTNVSWNFSYDVDYTFENGTDTTETVTAPAGDQEVWMAYFVENFNITTDRVIEALDLSTTFDIVQLGEGQAETNSSISYNGTTKSGTNATFQAPVIANQSVQTVATTASGATTFTFKNTSKTLSTASDNVTVHNKILTDCSAGSASQTEALKFALLDETNWQNSINGEVMYNFDMTVKGRDTDNFAFGTRSGSSIPTCIYPTWAEYRITGPIQYQATDYTDRTYNLYNVTVNNQSETYDLYLLPSNESTSIFLKVVDSGGQPVSGVTIQVLRYFIGKDAYVTIAKSETDSEGLTSTYMKVNEIYYKYIVTRNGTVLQETDRQILACSATPCTKTIKINPTTVDPYYKNEQNFASDCWVNKQDSTLQCTVTYKDAAPQKARLVVDELLTIGTNRTCDITVESTTSSLVCNVGNLSTIEYQYVLTGYVDGEEYVLQHGTIGVTKAIFDDNIVFAFLVFLAITGLGYRRPSQTILFATLGFFATAWLKLFTVSAGILAGVGIIALLLIIQMERL